MQRVCAPKSVFAFVQCSFTILRGILCLLALCEVNATLVWLHFPKHPVISLWIDPYLAKSNVDIVDTADTISIAWKCHLSDRLCNYLPIQPPADAFRIRTATMFSYGTMWLGCRANLNVDRATFSICSNIVDDKHLYAHTKTLARNEKRRKETQKKLTLFSHFKR